MHKDQAHVNRRCRIAGELRLTSLYPDAPVSRGRCQQQEIPTWHLKIVEIATVAPICKYTLGIFLSTIWK